MYCITVHSLTPSIIYPSIHPFAILSRRRERYLAAFHSKDPNPPIPQSKGQLLLHLLGVQEGLRG